MSARNQQDPTAAPSLGHLVTALVPTLSRSLAEEFNVFRVMRHGTHEKQLSNVFAWLLNPDGTHDLGDVFQRLFVERINQQRGESAPLARTGYRVLQEVDTRGDQEVSSGTVGKDIADIVLLRPDAAVVIENFGTSDGHGHEYSRYLDHGVGPGRDAVVVLLCHRHESHLQTDGWENAAVVTYDEILVDLRAHLATTPSWRTSHLEQSFFIDQLLHHFVEGPAAVNLDDQLDFLRAMCDTGESARFGHRPHDRADEEFAALVADHARRQFADGRATLGKVKRRLREYARQTLIHQLSTDAHGSRIRSADSPNVGQWEYCIVLRGLDGEAQFNLEFGPTAVVEVGRVPLPSNDPDYSRIFLTRPAVGRSGIDRLVQTDVTLREVLDGLRADDHRLRDAVLASMDAG